LYKYEDKPSNVVVEDELGTEQRGWIWKCPTSNVFNHDVHRAAVRRVCAHLGVLEQASETDHCPAEASAVRLDKDQLENCK
jgi:hypothetical protein